MRTDEPGVVVHSPRRQLARLLVLYAVLPLICAGAGTFIAYELGNQRTDARLAALEEDLEQRRAASAAANAERDARLAQTRRDLCVVIDRVQPRDAAVEGVRRRYGCAPVPPGSSPAPSVSPSPEGRPSPDGTGGRSGTGDAGGGTRPAGGQPPAPQPGAPGGPGPSGPGGQPPAPAPSPAPPPEPELELWVDVCVPLLDQCV